MKRQPKPIILALDITDVILASLAMPGMQVFFQYYPVKDMFEDLLRTNPCPGEMDLFYEKIDTLIPHNLNLDLSILELFAERFYMDMDILVSNELGKKYDECIYIMKGWLNSNSVLLEVISYAHNNNLSSMHEPGAPF